MILLGCLVSIHETTEVINYSKKLSLLSKVLINDKLWKHVFQQTIIFKPELTYYKDIINNELAIEKNGVVKPHIFLMTIFKQRFRLGNVLNLGLMVLQQSFRCLSFKHLSHLLQIINLEISRSFVPDTVIKRTGIAKQLASIVLTKMAAMYYVDPLVNETVAFLEMYEHNDKRTDVSRFKLLPIIQGITTEMKKVIDADCVVSDREKYVDELKVTTNKLMYDPVKIFSIPAKIVKEMFNSSMERMKKDFGDLPLDGMAMSSWQDLLEFGPKFNEKKIIKNVIE